MTSVEEAEKLASPGRFAELTPLEKALAVDGLPPEFHGWVIVSAMWYKAHPGWRQRKTVKNGTIYFIQARDSGAIKIGFATSVERRLTQLQAGNAEHLSVLAEIPGTMQDEKLLHKHFADAHIRGEWFQETPEIRNYIWRYRR